MVRLTTLMLLLLASPGVALAEGEAPAAASPLALTLGDCLRRAAAFNPLIAAAQHRVEQAVAASDAMGGRALPSLDALAMVGPVPAAHGNPMQSTTPVNDYGYIVRNLGVFFRGELSAVQPLWTFGKIDAGKKALSELTEVRQSELTKARWDTVTEVKGLYYGLLLAHDLAALLDELEEKTATASDYLEKHLEEGEGDVQPVDRLKLRAYRADLRAQRVELTKRRGVVVDGLTRFINAESADAWKPADDKLEMVQPELAKLEELVAEALKHEPLLVAADHGLRALEAKRAAYVANYLPDLFAAGRIRYGLAPNRDPQSSPFANDGFNFFDLGVAVGARWHWDTGVLGHEIDEVSAEHASLGETRRALALKVEHDVNAAYLEYTAAKEKVEAATEGFRATRAWSLFAYNGFEIGTISAKDLLDALSAFAKARFTLLDALYQHNIAVAQLSVVVGRELLPELASMAAP
jgi:outer membrane protein, multidrug efflux system